MKKMQPYVKLWYDGFEEGKILGMKCNKCGTVEFPPVPVCNKCSSQDMDWYEMQGTGQVIALSGRRGPSELTGLIHLSEGSSYSAPILNVDMANADALYDKMPVDATLEIIQRDGYKFIGIEVKE